MQGTASNLIKMEVKHIIPVFRTLQKLFSDSEWFQRLIGPSIHKVAPVIMTVTTWAASFHTLCSSCTALPASLFVRCLLAYLFAALRVFIAALCTFSCAMWDLVPWPAPCSGSTESLPLDHQRNLLKHQIRFYLTAYALALPPRKPLSKYLLFIPVAALHKCHLLWSLHLKHPV